MCCASIGLGDATGGLPPGRAVGWDGGGGGVREGTRCWGGGIKGQPPEKGGKPPRT